MSSMLAAEQQLIKKDRGPIVDSVSLKNDRISAENISENVIQKNLTQRTTPSKALKHTTSFLIREIASREKNMKFEYKHAHTARN